MHIISLCRNIFDYVFIVSTIAYVVMSFREYVPKEENEIKAKSDVAKEEKVYDIIQIIIIVAALAIFLVGVIYGVSNKKFLWLFILVGVPAYLEKIASAFVSIGIVGDVVKTNDEGTLTFREHTAIFLIASVVLILQTVKCFEHSKDFVMGYCGSIIADLLLLLMYVIILFVYIFLTCSLIPILMLFGTRILKKIAGYVPGKGALKKCGNFFTERIEKSIKQSQLTITFLKKVKGRNVFVKILCMPIIIVAIIMDIVIFLFNVVCSFVISSIGYIIIICRILKRACKKVINAIFKLSDKKIVAVSFRIAIIAALVITVIINRYDVFVKNVEESTAVLEFVASSIIIPVVFEWINSGRKSTEIEKNSEGQ